MFLKDIVQRTSKHILMLDIAFKKEEEDIEAIDFKECTVCKCNI